MPNLDRFGRALCSSDGAGDVSIDRVLRVTGAGQARWLDDVTFLANVEIGADEWRVLAIDVDRGDVTTLDVHGANRLVAGGGRWLGWSDGRGMFGSLGDHPLASPLAAGRDGTLAWRRDYQSGIGLTLTPPSGPDIDIANAVAFDVQVLGPTSAIWWDGRTVSAVDRPTPRCAVPPTGLRGPRLATVDGEDWLLYWREDVGLIAQVDGAADGFVLETRPICFGFDLVGVGSQLIVAWSVTSGEAPTDLRWKILDRTQPRVRLAPPPSVPVPPPVPPTPPAPPVPPAPTPHPTPPPSPSPAAQPFRRAARLEGHMEPTRYALRLGQFFASITPGDVYPDGILKGWSRVQFRQENRRDAEDCVFLISQPRAGDPKLLIRHARTGVALSADATEFSGDIAGQFSGKPNLTDADWGGYEAWDGWTHDDIHIVTVTYDRNGERYESAQLTAVAL